MKARFSEEQIIGMIREPVRPLPRFEWSSAS